MEREDGGKGSKILLYANERVSSARAGRLGTGIVQFAPPYHPDFGHFDHFDHSPPALA